MKIDLLTLFPEMFSGPLDVSIVARARKDGLLDLCVHNLRQWTHDRHKTVDDKPFGGGAGMVLKPEPIFEAVESLADHGTHVILTTPAGRPFSQAIARELAQQTHLLLICPSYEGVDERVCEVLTRGRRSSGVCRCRRSCSRATTPKSKNGGPNRPGSGPRNAGRICCKNRMTEPMKPGNWSDGGRPARAQARPPATPAFHDRDAIYEPGITRQD